MFSGCNVKREPEANGELQDVLDTLMMAQTYLFEFLDDYYDTDMIRKRQMDVYVSFLLSHYVKVVLLLDCILIFLKGIGMLTTKLNQTWVYPS